MIPEEYYKAGNILAKAIYKTKDIIKSGIPIIEICEFVEGEIENLGAKPSFPANVDINEIGAHYTSPPNDKSKIPDNSVVKLDAGSHINGFINDMAITINLGEEKYNEYIEAAEEGLATAIKHIKPGVKVDLIGEIVEKKINSYDLRPISNLSGHQLKQYNLHAGQSIPSVKSGEEGHATIRPDGTIDFSTKTKWKPSEIFQIFGKQKGGIFSKPTMGIFGEAGAEALLPLEGPNKKYGMSILESIIPKYYGDLMHQQGGIYGGGRTTTITETNSAENYNIYGSIMLPNVTNASNFTDEVKRRFRATTR